MLDDWLSQTYELSVTTKKIFLIVVCSAICLPTAHRTPTKHRKQPTVASPVAVRTLDTITNSGEDFIERYFQGNCGVECRTPLRQPVIQENRLLKTAGKTIEHPATGLTGKPICEQRTHQVIREIFTPSEYGSRLISKIRPHRHLLAEKHSSPQITQTETLR